MRVLGAPVRYGRTERRAPRIAFGGAFEGSQARFRYIGSLAGARPSITLGLARVHELAASLEGDLPRFDHMPFAAGGCDDKSRARQPARPSRAFLALCIRREEEHAREKSSQPTGRQHGGVRSCALGGDGDGGDDDGLIAACSLCLAYNIVQCGRALDLFHLPLARNTFVSCGLWCGLADSEIIFEQNGSAARPGIS